MHQGSGGNSTGASGQDYQKYMHQYADKYMGGAKQNSTQLNAKHGEKSTGQDYQQYMHQYADKYMGAGGYQKYMNQGGNSTGASGQGYQQYMNQYAGKYMGAANQNTTQLNAQSSYMSYAGQYGNAKELAGSVQKNPA